MPVSLADGQNTQSPQKWASRTASGLAVEHLGCLQIFAESVSGALSVHCCVVLGGHRASPSRFASLLLCFFASLQRGDNGPPPSHLSALPQESKAELMWEHPRADPPLPGFSPRALPERGYCPWAAFTLWSHRPAACVACGMFPCSYQTRMQTEMTPPCELLVMGPPRGCWAHPVPSLQPRCKMSTAPVWSRGTWLWEGEAGWPGAVCLPGPFSPHG